MIQMIQFSIIIATFNRGHSIQKALDSLLQQTEISWEAIIIDDGSIDDTKEKVAPYLQLQQSFHYYYQENKGVALAKNKGILKAKGKYITFLDSDDYYLPNHLAERNAILKKNPTIDFLHGGVKILGSEYVPDKWNEGKMIHLSECSIGGTFFIKRQLVHDLGLLRHYALGSDSDLYDRSVAAGIYNIQKTDIPTYVYNRLEPTSITHLHTPSNVKKESS